MKIGEKQTKILVIDIFFLLSPIIIKGGEAVRVTKPRGTNDIFKQSGTL